MDESNNRIPIVLVADDDPAFRQAFIQMLRMRGFETEAVGEAAEVANKVAKKQYDLLTLDLNWDQEALDGLSIFQKVQEVDPLLPVIVITGQATIPTAIEATRRGAFDYIEKIQDREKTLLTIKNAIETGRLKRANQVFFNELKSKHQLIGNSVVMLRLKQQIEQIGPTSSTVLITGKSGTGKELVAHQIHYTSSQRNDTFVSVDAGTISDTIAESELFGHRKGSFTGALTDRTGLIHEAEGGTLFLDEIANASPTLQMKLLHLLQESEYRRVGDNVMQQANVRIIAASNQDLPGLVDEGKFRKDLYYRLNVLEIAVPPLSERLEDIPLLARHFVKMKSLQCCRIEKRLSPEAVNLLVENDWPGNVRQLENIIERSVIMTAGELIDTPDLKKTLNLDFTYNYHGRIQTLNEMTQEFRRQCIVKALNLAEGKVQKAATLLGIDRTHLYRLLKEFNLKNLDY